MFALESVSFLLDEQHGVELVPGYLVEADSNAKLECGAKVECPAGQLAWLGGLPISASEDPASLESTSWPPNCPVVRPRFLDGLLQLPALDLTFPDCGAGGAASECGAADLAPGWPALPR